MEDPVRPDNPVLKETPNTPDVPLVLPPPTTLGPRVPARPTLGSIGQIIPPIYNPGDLDRNPTAIHTESPVVRNELLHATESVLLEFIVTPAGIVTNVKVISSTDRELEEPTVRAIYRWRFEPGIKDGKPVATRMRLPIRFNPAN